MGLEIAAGILSGFLTHMLNQVSKVGISSMWSYDEVDAELKEKLEMDLHKLGESLENINKNNLIQMGNIFSSEWFEEIEKLCYEMYDLIDESKKESPLLKKATRLRSLIELFGKVKKMQNELERKHAIIQKEKQDESSSGQRLKEKQELPSQTRQNLWVEDKNAIIQKLIEADSLGVTIVGICGSGKTLLAQAVEEDKSISDRFHIIHAPPLTKFSYDCVKKCIEEKLFDNNSRRVLILLDDLQEVDPTQWAEFRTYCKGKLHSESKVLVTTQNPQIANATGTNKHLLGKFADDECFLMILDIASTNSNLSCHDESAITAFKDELVQKCMGLPLLANCIGALLSAAGPGERETTIKEIIFGGLWKLEECASVLKKMTLVSLLQKEPFLKWCLNYCSLFPPDTEFNKDLLVQLWMAEGLSPPSTEEEDFFEYLLSHSIFQSSDNKPPYEMHPLAYDFAQNVSSRAFHREDIGESSHSTSPGNGITDETRHFSLSCKDSTGIGQETAVNRSLDVIREKCKGLRTFLLVQPAGELISENPTFFQSLTHLRVLDLSHTRLKELSPKTISKLRCLCYLDLSSTPIIEVPSLSKNLALKVLKLNGCKNLRTLPKDLAKLTNLLYFQADIVTKLVEMPPWMGQLKKLRGLEVYLVGATKTGDGKGIEQLKEINDLRKTLKIARLENVKSESEAREAELQKKLKLETLNLEWSADSTHAEAKEVLEGLKPPQTLTELRIINYSGSEFPEWLSRPDVCQGLNTIKLENCKACSNLPPLGNLPLLKHILLTGMGALERLPALPSSLKSLSIDNCSDALKQHCLDVRAPWRQIKDLLVKIDGHTVLHESSSTQIADPPAINDSDSSTLHEDRRRAPSLMPRDASGSVGQKLDKNVSLTPHEAKVSDHVIMEETKEYFSILSLLPKNYEFEEDTLIQLWMAAGHIKDETKGKQHFNHFLNQKYLLRSGTNFFTNKGRYHINIEICQKIKPSSEGQNYTLRWENECNTDKYSTEIQHVSLVSKGIDQTIFQKLQQFRELRTLLFLANYGPLVKEIPVHFFKSFKKLRALDLSGTHIKMLPNSVDQMHHLRYLDLSRTLIKWLPGTICSLKELQTLKLRECWELCELPEQLNNLTELRDLDVDVLCQLSTMPKGMKALQNLRTLSAFLVGTEDGYKVNELENLNNLTGNFCIAKLENVGSEDEARNAALDQKKNIKRLEFRWTAPVYSWMDNKSDPSVVLERLEPCSVLEELQILCYEGLAFPHWVSNPEFEKLVRVSFYKCENVSELPPLEYLPSLKDLILVQMNSIEGFEVQGTPNKVAFPSLEKLEMNGMQSLTTWRLLTTNDDDFKSLTEITINDCPSLREFDGLPSLSSIKCLEISMCPKLASVSNSNKFPETLDTLKVEGIYVIRKKSINSEDEDEG